MTNRIKLAVIGLGQCGGNLANTFAKYGYPSMAINTSILDLKDLANIPENRKVYTPLPDSDGAGKDPHIGERAIISHLPNILTDIEQFLIGAEAVLITAGLGGGTGSNIALLGNVLKRFNLPILTLVTIPTNEESALSKINALRAINGLIAENFDSCIIVDNHKILVQFPNSNLSAFYPQANEYVVKTFNNFNSTTTEYSSRSLLSFDNEDFRKVLLSRGILIFGETEVPVSQIKSLDDILPRLREIWSAGPLMADGFNLATAACGAISIYAPEAVLKQTSSQFLNMLGEEFKLLTNGATCYFGIYELANSETIKISTMLGRLTIPIRLQEMLMEATSEGMNLAQKFQQEMPTLDMSALDGIDLFGSTANLHGSDRQRHQEGLEAQYNHGFEVASHENPQASVEPELEPNPVPDEAERSYSLEDYVKIKKSKTSV